MKPFNPLFTEITYHRQFERTPDFSQLMRVLRGGRPDRPVLFELFMNDELYGRLADRQDVAEADDMAALKHQVTAFRHAGYDYVTLHATPDFYFHSGRRMKAGGATVSINEGAVITDRSDFEQYAWPDPDQADYSRLESIRNFLPEGMRAIVYGPGGVLENVIELAGYESLCYMLTDEPELARDLFDAVGSRLVEYYRHSAAFETVGALISNDDWGFNSQTMLSVDDMRRYVFPWHQRIVEVIHAQGKPAILHSCGNLRSVMDDVIDMMRYDAKHSFEDKIQPVEQSYLEYGDRISILGGIDMDFLCRAEPRDIYRRAAELLDLTDSAGCYALGSGNSIPVYVPAANYLAMISAALFHE